MELKSLVSRFEVGTVKAGTGLDALTVEAVYVNFFYNDYGQTSSQNFSELTWPVTYTPRVGYRRRQCGRDLADRNESLYLSGVRRQSDSAHYLQG